MAVAEGWEADRIARWVRLSARIEAQLAPVSDVLFAAAALQPGASVLDVGCGTGPTTIAAAAAVGAGGSVTGLDVGQAMLDVAAERSAAPGSAPIEWVCADAVTWRPAGPAYDVVLSRFGVMFFSDPVTAFTNIATATRPGGRLTMATWARRDESELFGVPLHAALEVLGRDASELPDDVDAFSLPDRAAIEAVLLPAGWTDVQVEPHRVPLAFHGGVGPAEAAAAALELGPVQRAVKDLDDLTRAHVVDAIARAFEDHAAPDGSVVLRGSIVVTTAAVETG